MLGRWQPLSWWPGWRRPPGTGARARTAAKLAPRPDGGIPWTWPAVGGALVLLHLLLFPVAPRHHQDLPAEGAIADRDITASVRFKAPLLEQDVAMRQMQRMLLEPPVVREQPGRRQQILARFRALRAMVRNYAGLAGMTAADRVGLLGVRYPDLDPADLQSLLEHPSPDSLLAAAGTVLADLLRRGVVDQLPPGNYRQVRIVGPGEERLVSRDTLLLQSDVGEALAEGLRQRGLPAADAALAARLARPFVTPVLVYDAAEHQRRRTAAARAVPRQREFLPGEKVIARGERVTAQDALYLQALAEAERGRGRAREPAAVAVALLRRVLLLAVMIVLSGWLVSINEPRRRVLREPRVVLAAGGLMAVFLLLAAFCLRRPLPGPWAVPVPLLAVLATILFRDRVGYPLTTLAVLLLAAVPGVRLGWVLDWLILGLVSVSLLRRISQRDQFYQAIAVLVGTQAALVLLLRSGDAVDVAGLGQVLLAGALSPVVAVAFALFLLPILEPLVGSCSDLTLLELSDLNHPLLKEMSLRAQGTFHHSQVVAQLAEQAARAIGANALLTRVGALFHDIGKIAKPDYYVENQQGGVNRHDELSPRMSALVVASHVKEGIELARQWRLPEQVVAFIPEHHGTQVMKFFFHKALEQSDGEPVKVEDYRYPGPRPQSRETAIVMLADAVEAAARSLAKPTPSRLREVTKQIVEDRLLSGELDDSALTLRDLATIREAFLSVLSGIHHARIAYPGQRPAGEARSGGAA